MKAPNQSGVGTSGGGGMGRKQSGGLRIRKPTSKERREAERRRVEIGLSPNSLPIYKRSREAREAVAEQHRSESLRLNLQKQIEALRYAIRSERSYPSRLELYRRFKIIEDSARLLLKELLDLRIAAFLAERDDQGVLDDVLSHEFMAGLELVAARTASTQTLKPRKPGRGKWYPQSGDLGPSPQELCALFVGMTWERERGRWPPKANRGAHAWCEAYWSAAGGPPRPARGQSTEIWRVYLQSAKKYRPPHAVGSLVKGRFLDDALPRQTVRRRAPSNFYHANVSAGGHSRVTKNQK